MGSTSEGASRGDATIWTSTFLVCIGLFGLVAWITLGHNGPSPDGAHGEGAARYVTQGMSWPPLHIDAEALEAERQAQRTRELQALGARHESDATKALLDAVRALNDHQFQTAPIPSRTTRELEDELNVALSSVIGESAPEHFMVLGEPLFKACAQGREAILKEVAAGGEAALERAMEDADFEKHALYRRNCGNMLTELRERNLIDARGTWTSPEAPRIASIMERYRWASLVRLYEDPMTLLTPLEREVFSRWRVEDRDAFSLEQREGFVEPMLHHLPDYPAGLPAAMFAYERGDLGAAAEILSRYHNQNPKSPVYTPMQRALLKEINGGSSH